jgi:hypothetical protein
MDDLKGLDWSNSSSGGPPKSAFPTLRPTPSPSISGRSTPNNVLQPSSAASLKPSIKVPSKPGTPANDSFASLLSSTSVKSSNNLSLQERQRQVLEEKARKAAEESKRFDAHFSSHGSFPIPRVQNGSSTLAQPNPIPLNAFGTKNGAQNGTRSGNDDLLAGFLSGAPVNRASHFPPSSSPDALSIGSASKVPKAASPAMDFAEDDDPFGLNELAAKRPAPAPSIPTNDDDDILGMLGKPEEEVAAMRREKEKETERQSKAREAQKMSPEDKAVASLVDMGFEPDQAAIALASTDSGRDVQGAIAILLNQAHAKSRTKTSSNDVEEERQSRQQRPTYRQARDVDDDSPAWMRSGESSQNRGQNSGKDKDVTQFATEIGSSLFKSANSLWKTGQRRVQKAVAELANEPGESNQPKWMRDAKMEADAERKSNNPFKPEKRVVDMTNEAMLLEGGGRPSLSTRPAHPRHIEDQSRIRVQSTERRGSPFSDSGSADERPREAPRVAAHRLTKEELARSEPEVYISPARRRKPQATRDTSLLETAAPIPRAKSPLASPPIASNNPFATVAKSSQRSTPTPTRPRAPPRRIPPASDSALSTSASHRQSGSEAFKRGDFSAAQEAYTRALQPLPSTHPVTIIVLCNRALTYIKVGEPKAAVADADFALEIIGVSRGEGEKINLGMKEGEKDMKDFYGKALMRKAEALENMEKWTDAGAVWKLAVEAGVGGSVAIQGRTRCEKALGGGSNTASRPAVRPKPKPKPIPTRSALDDLAGTRPGVTHEASAEAVRKLREANAAAERADDEKFALTDLVDAKLVLWKGTKADNLRALLGSLDKVLWDGAGWTKVGMQDLVMANRVKIIYMKAIAKVHPDKVSC